MSRGQYTCSICEADFHDRCVNLACIVGYHNVLSTEPRSIPEESDEPLEEDRRERYRYGQAVGLEAAVRKLRDKAARAFLAGDDKHATLLRDMANEFEQNAAAIRKEVGA